MAVSQETFLNLSDYESIGEMFRALWNTRRLSLGNPTATILRYSEYPNPTSMNTNTLVNDRLHITENIVGRVLHVLDGVISKDYVVTGYNLTSITVATADFIADSFTTLCTFHIDALKYQKLESPTKVQVVRVGEESLLDRDVAYYNVTEEEIVRFNNEFDSFDRKFVFYDIFDTDNNDVIVLNGQQYAVRKHEYSFIYNKVFVYGKAIRKD